MQILVVCEKKLQVVSTAGSQDIDIKRTTLRCIRQLCVSKLSAPLCGWWSNISPLQLAAGESLLLHFTSERLNFRLYNASEVKYLSCTNCSGESNLLTANYSRESKLSFSFCSRESWFNAAIFSKHIWFDIWFAVESYDFPLQNAAWVNLDALSQSSPLHYAVDSHLAMHRQILLLQKKHWKVESCHCTLQYIQQRARFCCCI